MAGRGSWVVILHRYMLYVVHAGGGLSARKDREGEARYDGALLILLYTQYKVLRIQSRGKCVRGAKREMKPDDNIRQHRK